MALFIILFSLINAVKYLFVYRSMAYNLHLLMMASKQIFENLYIDVRNYCYAYGNMADCSDNGRLLCSSISVNNVNDISTSSKPQPTPVTRYTVSYSELH